MPSIPSVGDARSFAIRYLDMSRDWGAGSLGRMSRCWSESRFDGQLLFRVSEPFNAIGSRPAPMIRIAAKHQDNFIRPEFEATSRTWLQRCRLLPRWVIATATAGRVARLAGRVFECRFHLQSFCPCGMDWTVSQGCRPHVQRDYVGSSSPKTNALSVATPSKPSLRRLLSSDAKVSTLARLHGAGRYAPSRVSSTS